MVYVGLCWLDGMVCVKHVLSQLDKPQLCQWESLGHVEGVFEVFHFFVPRRPMQEKNDKAKAKEDKEEEMSGARAMAYGNEGL